MNTNQTNVKYAGTWVRVLSFLIDYFLITILIESLRKIINFDFNQIILIFILYIIYASFFISSNIKSTVGQKIFKLQTVTIDFNKLSFPKAFLRNTLAILFILPLFIIHFVYALFTEYSIKKQTIYDVITKTIVIKN